VDNLGCGYQLKKLPNIEARSGIIVNKTKVGKKHTPSGASIQISAFFIFTCRLFL
jgi:hypothetical protein